MLVFQMFRLILFTILLDFEKYIIYLIYKSFDLYHNIYM